MKGDLADMKTLVSELIKMNNLQVPNIQNINKIQQKPSEFYQDAASPNYDFQIPPNTYAQESGPIVINNPTERKFHPSELVEDNLSLEVMEKDLIIKALDKHSGKRKYAAQDLGISERTLYRKIKSYGIDE